MRRRLGQFRRELAQGLCPVYLRLRGGKPVDNLSRTDQAQIFPGDFFEVKVIMAQPVNSLPQEFILLLQEKVRFAEFPPLSP